MRLYYKSLIALSHFYILIFCVLTLQLVGCNSEIENNLPVRATIDLLDPIIDLEGDLEISDFIWKSLNQYYYWQDDILMLSDSISEEEKLYAEYISKNENAKVFFNDLIHPEDKFSFLQDNYRDLENLIQGIEASNGVEFGLLFACQTCRQLIGYVKYILEGSNASTKDIKRGDLFTGVNGIQLTVDNYNELLFGDNLAYTLNMVLLNNGVIINNGKEVKLLKEEKFQFNPIQVAKTLDTSMGKVGYLMYNQFVPDKSSLLNQIFGEFKSEGILDLILDLRYNGGGSVKNCVALGSMITGQFPSQVFVQEEWNLKMSNYLSVQFGKESFKERFISSLPNGEIINSLSLRRIFILTSSESASASELLINGLSSFIDVIHIGERTVGKNVGSITVYDYIDDEQTKNPDHTVALQPIVLKIANNDGYSDYSDGLEPDFNVKEKIDDFGVLGDTRESLLSYAISIITESQISSTLKESSIPLIKVQDPLMMRRQGMFVDKKINLKELN